MATRNQHARQSRRDVICKTPDGVVFSLYPADVFTADKSKLYYAKKKIESGKLQVPKTNQDYYFLSADGVVVESEVK